MHPDLVRFYAADVNTGSSLTLTDDEVKHARVLRLKRGMKVHVVNGKGALYEASVADDGKRFTLRVEQLAEQREMSDSPLWLAVAPTKNTARFEWVVEKSVEIGVDRIIPIHCQRSERIRLNAERLARIASSAMKQSKVLWMPVIDDLTPFEHILKLPLTGKWIAHCDEKMTRQPLTALASATGHRLVCIGPEGDFSPQEIDQATAAGFTGLSLGTNRLRTETAAIAACIAAALLHG